MKLIISTDGRARPNYLDMSNEPLVDVPTAEDIRYSRTTGQESDGTHVNRSTVHVDLTPEQTLDVIENLLSQYNEVSDEMVILYTP